MDKQNRLTRNDEWEIGARYRYTKGTSSKRSKNPTEVTFLGWAEKGFLVGTAEFLQSNGEKSLAHSAVWRNRYAKIDAPAPPLRQTPNALSGQYFHSIGMDTGKVEWQGVVLGSTEPGLYLVQIFEWIMGEPNVRRLVKIEDMEHWLFYPDAWSMRFSYEQGVARAGGKYRDR